MTHMFQMRALAATAACALMLSAAPAIAFHPGQTHTGVVPQGPHQTACGNAGRTGVDTAIGVGGAVHCEPVNDPDEGEDGEDDHGEVG